MLSVLRLVDEAEAEVRRLDSPAVPESVLLRPLGPVRENLAAGIMGGNVVTWASSVFDSGVRNDLETCSYVLNSAARLRPLEGDSLAEIRELVVEIMSLATADGGLDDETRLAILRYAQDMLRALDLYKVRGAQALVDELDRFTTESRRLKSHPSELLSAKLKALTAAVVVGVGLFTGPADVMNAVGTYGEVINTPAVVEAPAAGDPTALDS